MAIYIISDTHFGHKNIIKFERTKYETIEEHDLDLIERINKQVKLTDTLYILGDVGNIETCRQLNGYKILLMGNHDKRNPNEYKTVFAEVYTNPIYISSNIVISHHPIPVSDSVLNIHGHLHGAIIDKRNYYNASAWLMGMRPTRIDYFHQLAATLPKENNNFLEEWFAPLYKFTTPRNDVITDASGRILLTETKKHREKLYK